jgi:hypothetical protein
VASSTITKKENKFKITRFAGKVMITVFCDTYGVILVDVMARSKAINSDATSTPSRN